MVLSLCVVYMYVVCRQGDWVWLKRCQNGENVTEISETTQAIFIKVRDKEQESKIKFIADNSDMRSQREA